jgi:pimeloyl-ACP methyl ester carboxylesterase
MLCLPIARMRPPEATFRRVLLGIFLSCPLIGAEAPAPSSAWTQTHDLLVARLGKLMVKENEFGPAYRPLYHAALPWYELWGGRDPRPVDDGMVSPEAYAAELAGAMEQGRNYFAENPSALFPLVFHKKLPGGKEVAANYWLSLPAGFPQEGRTFPLIVGLHGSGWLGHKISYKRGNGPAGRTFGVTPINMGGPWQIDFLNAYLDELLAILPVDRDRVYVEGHSLGAMATWEWAIDNPERFAAISPRAGVGEPYRASRLKYIPAWVIHGENDDVIPTGFAEQMVTALQAQGAGVRYSIIPGGPHNMPADLDESQVVDWYLKQIRSPLPVPSDPRDKLGLGDSGFSPWEVVSVPDTPSWKSPAVMVSTPESLRNAIAPLFRKAHARGEWVDAPIRQELDPKTKFSTLWLAVPRSLHASGPADPSIAPFPASKVVRFYFRGETQRALDHLQQIEGEVQSAGHPMAGRVWITALSLWWLQGPGSISECWIETK